MKTNEDEMVTIRLSKTRAKRLRAFINHYEWRERERFVDPGNRNAALDVVRQITQQTKEKEVPW